MKILLHICCAPCGIYPSRKLGEKFEVWCLWYNPNIHPYSEYKKRLEAVKLWEEKEEVKIIYEDSYNLVDFLRRVVYREEERCFFCYEMRLRKTAIFACRGKFDYFGTTLLFSPHQRKKELKEILLSLGKEYQVKPWLEEIGGAHRKSLELSRKMGLYHQTYCGCIYSEWERFGKEKRSFIFSPRVG